MAYRHFASGRLLPPYIPRWQRRCTSLHCNLRRLGVGSDDSTAVRRPPCARISSSSPLSSISFWRARWRRHAAAGLASEAWSPLAEQAVLVFVLILGFAAFWSTFRPPEASLSRTGLAASSGLDATKLAWAWPWAGRVAARVCAPVGHRGRHRHRSFPADVPPGVAARGHAFLRPGGDGRGSRLPRLRIPAVRAVSSGLLAQPLGFAAFYAIVQALQPGSSHVEHRGLRRIRRWSFPRPTCAPGALWLSWGLNFGWKASRALDLRARGQRSEQPLVGGRRRSDGSLLAHRRRLRPRWQLGRFLRPACGDSRGLSRYARSGFPLQRPSDRPRRNSRRSRCRGAPPA